MNLIRDPWIRVRLKGGGAETVRACDIVRPDIEGLNFVRMDFNAAVMEWLIGLLQSAVYLESEKDWKAWKEKPPTAADLQAYLAEVEPCFDFSEGGAKFMQDLAVLEVEATEIGSLFMSDPGAKTLKENKDLFVKRGWCNAVCESCLAAGLYVYQTYSHADGTGYRTPLRGGGPISTLFVGENLWQAVWLHVLPEPYFNGISGNPERDAIEDKYPWMAATRTSESGTKPVAPADAHPLTMYWGMPRRVSFDWQKLEPGICDLCSMPGQVIGHFRRKNYGTNYKDGWRHPLSPYNIGIPKKGESENTQEATCVHGQPDGIGYRHWLGLVLGDASSGRERAEVVSYAMSKGRVPSTGRRLHAFGYDFDNAKTRGWCEGEMPVYVVNEARAAEVQRQVGQLIEGAKLIASNTRYCYKEALSSRASDLPGDPSFVYSSFWSATENAFYARLEELTGLLERGEDTTAVREGWLKELKAASTAVFDTYTSWDPEESGAKRVLTARRRLVMSNAGPKVRGVLNLELTDAQQERKRKQQLESKKGERNG